MNTDSILRIKSISSEQTEQLGQAMGAHLKGGEIIELKSDLGGGKTTFTRGIAVGAKSPDDVASPTFTISRVYNTPTFTIHHFDFYRLQEPGIISYELQEIINDNQVVTIVEWGDIVTEVLPRERVTISFSHVNETERAISIELPKKYHYLLEGIAQ